MTMNFTNAAQANEQYAGLIAGLEIEFGHDNIEAFAAKMIAVERADFLWNGRVAEREIGTFESIDDDAEILKRVAIASVLDSRWYVGIALVGGDGGIENMVAVRCFDDAPAAGLAFDRLR